MHISDILSAKRTLVSNSAKSQKTALQALSDIVTNDIPSATSGELFTLLLERERLGSTGIGKGVAIPHARVDSLEFPMAACIKLDNPIDYDSPDSQPVSFIFALFVPTDATDEHLQILAKLAQCFSDNVFLNNLKASKTSDGLYNTIIKKCNGE